MTIKIVLPEGKGPKIAQGTKFYTSSGHEIKGVYSCDILLRPDQVIVATLEVDVSAIVNLDNIKAEVAIINRDKSGLLSRIKEGLSDYF